MANDQRLDVTTTSNSGFKYRSPNGSDTYDVDVRSKHNDDHTHFNRDLLAVSVSAAVAAIAIAAAVAAGVSAPIIATCVAGGVFLALLIKGFYAFKIGGLDNFAKWAVPTTALLGITLGFGWGYQFSLAAIAAVLPVFIPVVVLGVVALGALAYAAYKYSESLKEIKPSSWRKMRKLTETDIQDNVVNDEQLNQIDSENAATGVSSSNNSDVGSGNGNVSQTNGRDEPESPEDVSKKPTSAGNGDGKKITISDAENDQQPHADEKKEDDKLGGQGVEPYGQGPKRKKSNAAAIVANRSTSAERSSNKANNPTPVPKDDSDESGKSKKSATSPTDDVPEEVEENDNGGGASMSM